MSDPRPLAERLRAYRADVVVGTVRDTRGNISEAARQLEVDRSTVSRILRENGYAVHRLASWIEGDGR